MNTTIDKKNIQINNFHGEINEIQNWDELDLKPQLLSCLLYTSPSPRDRTRSRMPSSA